MSKQPILCLICILTQVMVEARMPSTGRAARWAMESRRVRTQPQALESRFGGRGRARRHAAGRWGQRLVARSVRDRGLLVHGKGPPEVWVREAGRRLSDRAREPPTVPPQLNSQGCLCAIACGSVVRRAPVLHHRTAVQHTMSVSTVTERGERNDDATDNVVGAHIAHIGNSASVPVGQTTFYVASSVLSSVSSAVAPSPSTFLADASCDHSYHYPLGPTNDVLDLLDLDLLGLDLLDLDLIALMTPSPGRIQPVRVLYNCLISCGPISFRSGPQPNQDPQPNRSTAK